MLSRHSVAACLVTMALCFARGDLHAGQTPTGLRNPVDGEQAFRALYKERKS